jgi:lipopolysaccharide transport system ATP-binding protein
MPDMILAPSIQGSHPAEDDVAIRLADVRKVYRLYSGPADQAIDVLGLSRAMFWRRKHHYPEFVALKGINLMIKRGERVGLVGRNGAGKTTLLKLISGNFAPTSGRVDVSGKVQALMQTGLGFHPEFTGIENIRSALVYNGLSDKNFESALVDVIDFVELGEFLQQPMKTYSAGMQARLQFACATAVRPDILIVDEVLGAGDAYFSAKSADRMDRLARSGCTLLLVSHSMSQVLQFCERALWIEQGTIYGEGRALDVVKQYESFTHELRISHRSVKKENQPRRTDKQTDDVTLPDQKFLFSVDAGKENIGSGELSRWPGTGDLRIRSVRTLDTQGIQRKMFDRGESLEFEIEIDAVRRGVFPCQYVVLIFSSDGRPLVRHLSQPYEVKLDSGESKKVRLRYDEILLGSGDYVYSVAIYKNFNLYDRSSVQWHDLISRGFEFKISGDFAIDPSIFHHPAAWIEAV